MVTNPDILILSVIVSVVEAVALAAVSYALAKSQQRSATIVADLMDRLMSRNFQEYSALRLSVGGGKRAKRAPLTDAEMAEIEKKAREGGAA